MSIITHFQAILVTKSYFTTHTAHGLLTATIDKASTCYTERRKTKREEPVPTTIKKCNVSWVGTVTSHYVNN
jgi:hypothetical protein